MKKLLLVAIISLFAFGNSFAQETQKEKDSLLVIANQKKDEETLKRIKEAEKEAAKAEKLQKKAEKAQKKDLKWTRLPS